MAQPVSNYQPSLALTQDIVATDIYPSGSGGGAFIGEIFTYAFSTPIGYTANGATVSINQNTALFTLIGTTYGGNGVQNFALPNLADTTMVGAGNGPGLPSAFLGAVEGTASTSLSVGQLPAIDGGTSTAFTDYQSSLPVNYLIRIRGIYPPRGDGSGQDGGSQDYIGEVIAYAGSNIPSDYAVAAGQILPIAQNTALFSLLGTTYGGDGRSTFALPNLQGRTIIGVDNANGLALGTVSGQSTVQLTNSQVPIGGSQPFDNHEPSLALNYLVSLSGLYPSAGSTPDADSVFLGQITAFAGNFAPAGYVFANGQLLSIAANTALYSLIGTTYGGDGVTTFAVPNLQGRVVTGTSVAHPLGSVFGTASTTVLAGNLPTIAAPSLTIGLQSDTGASASDRETASAKLSGTGVAGALVSVTIDGAPAGSVGSNGGWSFTPSSLSDGLHTVIARQTNDGGTGSASLSFTLDTTAPVLSNPGTVTVYATRPTGAAAFFAVTAADNIDGAADVVTFKEGAAAVHSGDVFTVGSHAITAGATDLAGNVGSAAFNVVVKYKSTTVANFLSNRPTLDAGDPFVVVDSAANIVGALDTLASDSHIIGLTLTDAGAPSLHVSGAQFTADAALLAKITNAAYTVTATNSDNSFVVQTGTATGSVVQTADANGHLIEQKFYVGANLFEDIVYDTAHRATSDTTYDSSGAVASQQTYYPGTTALREFVQNGITGASYNALDYTYAPDGTLVHQLLYAGAHKTIYDYVYDPATGAKSTSLFDASGAPTQMSRTNADLTTQVRSYGAGGVSSDVFRDAGGHLTKLETYDTLTHKTETLTYDTAGRVTSDTTYDAAGAVASVQTYYPGTTALREFVQNGITGASYNALDYSYAPDGTSTHQILYAGAHKTIYDYVYDPATGAKSTSIFDVSGSPIQMSKTNADLTTEVRSYAAGGSSSDVFRDASGHLTTFETYDTLTHKTETLTYDASGRVTSDTTYNATNAVAYRSTYYAGTTNPQHVDLYGVTGASYVALHMDFDPGNVLAYETYDIAGGGFSKVAFGDNRTLTTTTGVDDSLQAAGHGETFVFHANMGHDTLTSFVATGATHDILQFDASMFPGNANAAHLLSAFASDVAATTGPNAQPASVLLTFDAANSVLVRNATVATLQANPADFSFV